MKLELISNDEKQTKDIAEKFAKSLSFPLVISLKGELGAGKTTFTKGLAKGLGITENVTSPTFTILNEYSGEKCPLYHFDMYRLSSKEEAEQLGFSEYFDLTRLKGFSVVEWAENVEGLLPARHIEIELKKTGELSRKILIEIKGII